MKKKVLFITNSHPIPNYRRTWKKASALANDDYEVRVVCPTGLKKVGVKKVKKVEAHYYYKKEEDAAGGKKSLLGKELADLIKVGLKVFKIYLKRQFRIIHLANPSDTLVLICLFYKLLGYKFVYERSESTPDRYLREHAINPSKFALAILKWLERLAIKHAHLIIVPDYKDKHDLIRNLKAKKEKIVTIEPLPDLKDFYQPAINWKYKRGFPYMALYSGSLKIERGLVRLLDAVSFIVNGLGRKDILFVFAGTGRDMENLICYAERKGIAKNVYFAGWLNQEKLLGHLAVADLGLAPEPLKRSTSLFRDSILEYMALGKPVVSFNTITNRRKIGKAGVFVNEYNREAFAREIIRLLDNKDRSRAMGEMGRKRIERDLNWLRSELKLLGAYEELFRKKTLFGSHRLPERAAA